MWVEPGSHPFNCYLPPLSIPFTSSPGAKQIYNYIRSETAPYHAVPSIIAINMIMAVAAGGTTAVTIAMWARVYTIQFTLASSACTFPQYIAWV